MALSPRKRHSLEELSKATADLVVSGPSHPYAMKASME